jgi:hypothetical protein
MTRRVLIVVLIFAIAAAALILAPLEFAAAQQRLYSPPPQYGGGGFFNFLFGPPPSRQPSRPVQPAPSRRNPSPAPSPQAAAPPPVAKDPTAKKVVVVGDFVAGIVAAGLDQAYSGEAKIRIVDRSKSDSGLSRQDYYDWAGSLPSILTADRPDVVVAVFGANDRQQLTGNSTAQWGTPDWDAAYSDRVQALSSMLAAYGAPFFWVGTAPMRSTPEPDMAHLNDLYRPRVTAAGGDFVDIWDGFADDNGHLVISGPDVNGQTAQLRTGNGINFTDAGQAKLAFYVQREIQRLTGIATGNVELQASLSQSSRVEVGTDGKRRAVGPVISLTTPPPSGTTVLVGASPASDATAAPLLAAPKDPRSPQSLLVQGAALPAVPGRADDFTWPPGSKAPAPAAAPPPAIAAAQPAAAAQGAALTVTKP